MNRQQPKALKTLNFTTRAPFSCKRAPIVSIVVPFLFGATFFGILKKKKKELQWRLEVEPEAEPQVEEPGRLQTKPSRGEIREPVWLGFRV